MSAVDYIISTQDWKKIRHEYSILIGRTVTRLVPVLQFIKPVVEKPLLGPYIGDLVKETMVIPLPVLMKNEQKYADVVDILEGYEKIITDIYKSAGVDTSGLTVHIGGDQLTRERFSGAKRLRIGADCASERFDHLSPITFELFHMLMNYLMTFFKKLYNVSSENEIGTMKAEQTRISRSSVDPDVRKAYAADKDFVVSFVDSYIIEAVLEYFGMEDIYSAPSKHVPPPDLSDHVALKEWFQEEFGRLVDEMVAPTYAATLSKLNEDTGNVEGNMYGTLLYLEPMIKIYFVFLVEV